jgi:hypothetical protein
LKPWLKDLNSVGIHFQRRQARHICSIPNQKIFQAPSGAEYAAPTGLGNWVTRVATKISLLTELRTGALNKAQAESTRKRVMLGRQLYLDLCGRRDFDKRWENRRTAFLKKRPTLNDYSAMFLSS